LRPRPANQTFRQKSGGDNGLTAKLPQRHFRGSRNCGKTAGLRAAQSLMLYSCHIPSAQGSGIMTEYGIFAATIPILRQFGKGFYGEVRQFRAVLI